MIHASRPWHRSPVLWFCVPWLAFLSWAWVHSMFRVTNVDFRIAGNNVRLQNDGATIGASWHEVPPTRAVAKEFHFEVRPRGNRASKNWFPLPSYVVNRVQPARSWHYLDFPHWFLLLVTLALWQLPWLGRHFRRKRIAAGGAETERRREGTAPGD